MQSNTGFRAALAPLTVAALLSSGCGTNTRVDDGSYRAIGHQAPRQAQNYAATRINEQAASQSDLYVASGAQVQQEQIPVPDFPGAIEQASLRNTGGNRAADQHLARFGHPGIIDRIVKTARIHCQPVQYRISTRNNSFWGDGNGVLVQCSYRFPEFCGAHVFSLLSYEKKEVLVFKPKGGTHYVIDTLQGTPKSQPGLWDQDDHIGSSTTNAGYFFAGDYNQPHQQDQFNPASLGWIIKASHQDEEAFGKQYHQAVTDITRCF